MSPVLISTTGGIWGSAKTGGTDIKRKRQSFLGIT